MAYSDHLLRHRLLTADELTAEKARLTALNSGFTGLSMGTKAYQIATRDIIDQLNSIAFVTRERGYTVPEGPRCTKNTSTSTTDFSYING